MCAYPDGCVFILLNCVELLKPRHFTVFIEFGKFTAIMSSKKIYFLPFLYDTSSTMMLDHLILYHWWLRLILFCLFFIWFLVKKNSALVWLDWSLLIFTSPVSHLILIPSSEIMQVYVVQVYIVCFICKVPFGSFFFFIFYASFYYVLVFL